MKEKSLTVIEESRVLLEKAETEVQLVVRRPTRDRGLHLLRRARLRLGILEHWGTMLPNRSWEGRGR